MKTIQDQLREHGELIDDAYNQPGHASPWAVELYEAANRIDALEAALRKVASYTAPGHYDTGWDFETGCNEMNAIARKALESS